LFQYDNTVSFWNFAAAGNYAARFYKYAMQDIFALQSSLMNEHIQAMETMESSILTTLKANQDDNASIVTLLTSFTHEQGNKIVTAWKDLLPQLITKYHDGYTAEALTSPAIHMKKLFYSQDWLQATGYFKNPPTQGQDVIMFQPNPLHTTEGMFSTTQVSLQIVWTVLITSLVVATSSWVCFMRMYGISWKQHHGYTTLPV